MKIIQIVTHEKTILGLGDDGKMYRFDYQTQAWVLMEA